MQSVFKEAQTKFSVSPKAPPECQLTHYSAEFRDDQFAGEHDIGGSVLNPGVFPWACDKYALRNLSGQPPQPPKGGQNTSS